MSSDGADWWLAKWQASDHPSVQQVATMRAWLDRLNNDPRQEPSQLASREHPHKQDELRLTWIIDTEAFVVHALDQDDQPRVLYIGQTIPPGMEVEPP